MPRNFNHLSLEQRLTLKTMLERGISIPQIAKKLGVSPSTVYREVKRAGPGAAQGPYHPRSANQQYRNMLKSKGRTPLFQARPELASRAAELILKEKRSVPQTVELLNRAASEPVCSRNTLYSAIDAGLIPGVTRESLRSAVAAVSSDGSLLLPRWLRDRLHLQTGDQFCCSLTKDGGVTLEKIVK